MKINIFPGVALYRLVRRSYRIVEETQNGVTRFIPEHRCLLWPFWNPDEFFTSEYTTTRVSFPTLDKAREAIAKEQSRDVVARKIHSANGAGEQRRGKDSNHE